LLKLVDSSTWLSITLIYNHVISRFGIRKGRTMKRISIAISMIAIGVAVGVLVFGFGTIGEDEGTRGSTDNSYMDTATYIGSDSCSGCHATKHTDWANSLHSMMIQDPLVANVIGDFVNDPTLNDTANGIPDVIIDLDDTGGVFTVTLDNTTFSVDQTVGSFWKQRYLTQLNASMYFLPIQWNVETSEWVPYHLERWYNSAGDLVPQPSATEDSWDRGCAGCHTTGTDVTYSAGTNEWTATWSELSVGCEACHGPASDHMGNPDFIWKSVDAQICGSCHIRGTSNGTVGIATDPLGYPWSDTQGWYMPGDTLAEFYTPGEGTWGDEQDSSKQHHQQYRDWLTTESNGHAEWAPGYAQRTDCMSCRTTEGFIESLGGPTAPDAGNATWLQTCAACHSAHDSAGNDHQLRLPQNELCVACHTIGTQEIDHEPHHAQMEIIEGSTILDAQVTGSPWMGGVVTCTDCHMIGTAKSALPGDISSHTFKVIMPDQTAAVGVPNSCTSSCHDGTTGFTLTDVQAQSSIDSWESTILPLKAGTETNITAAEAALEEAAHQDFPAATMTEAEDLKNEMHFAFGVVDSGLGQYHNYMFAEDLLDFANTKANEIPALFETGMLNGTVQDQEGNAVVGANITYGDIYVLTDANGAFEFEMAAGTRTFSVLVNGVEEATFSSTVTVDGEDDVGVITIGEAPPPPDDDDEPDNLMLYLALIIVIIVVIVIVAVVAMKRKGGPSIEEEPMEEEMAPEPEPEMEGEE
jgi:predicted CXXCH cytochrome family protein